MEDGVNDEFEKYKSLISHIRKLYEDKVYNDADSIIEDAKHYFKNISAKDASYSVDLTPYCTEKQLELLIKVDNYINDCTANLNLKDNGTAK